MNWKNRDKITEIKSVYYLVLRKQYHEDIFNLKYLYWYV